MRRCVVFDLDGTLTASGEGILNCVRHALKELGRPVPGDEQLRAFIGPPLKWSFMHCAGMDAEEADRAVAAYRARYGTVGLYENSVYPGVRPLLRMLRRRGDWIAVATGKPLRFTSRVLEHFGLLRFFDRVIGPEDSADAGKAELIRAALPEKWDEAWMVGDRRFDIEGGREAGVRTAGAGWGYGTEAELRGAGCDFYAPDVAALTELLCPGERRPRGFFLSMEGLDGSGKTTQMDLLTEALRRDGFDVLRCREPGGTVIGEAIRELLLDPAHSEMGDETETLLYAASRAQLVREVIRPALEAGHVVLCDRFVDSSAAYQGGGRRLGVADVLAVNRMAVRDTMPLCTVYLDITHEAAMKRRLAASEPDRLERQADSFHARVEAAYRELLTRDPDRFVSVDAAKPPEEIAQEVAKLVLHRLTEAENG